MLSQRIVLIVSLGAGVGVLVGSAVTWWLVKRRLCDNMMQLLEQIALLTVQVDQLRKTVEERQLRKLGPTGGIEEDDDVYEDAYGDYSDTFYIDDQVVRNDVDVRSMYDQIDVLLEGTDGNKREAFEQMLNMTDQLKNDAEFLWRFSKATYIMSQREAVRDKGKQKELVYQALHYARRALELDDSNPNVHKWYAVTLGSVGDYESITVKIQNGYKFKEHIEKTIRLNPKDPSGHYLLGRWCFGVCMLSWMERKMAATLFAAPPTATVDEALEHFLEADRLNPGKWKENLLFIAKCYILKRDYTASVQWLQKATLVPVRSADDEVCEKEVISLLQQYSLYRR